MNSSSLGRGSRPRSGYLPRQVDGKDKSCAHGSCQLISGSSLVARTTDLRAARLGAQPSSPCNVRPRGQFNKPRNLKHGQFSHSLAPPLSRTGRSTLCARLFTHQPCARSRTPSISSQTFTAQHLRHLHNGRTQPRSAYYPLLGRWRHGLGRLPGTTSLEHSR